MKKFSRYLLLAITVSIIGFLYYYITLPAINIHSPGFWFFILGALIVISTISGIVVSTKSSINNLTWNILKKSKVFFISLTATLIMIFVFILGSILSSPLINAKKYQGMLTIEDRNFVEDIKEISYKDIPILDKSSASMLGSRTMGSIMEFVSQFEVADNYTQINYQGKPVRVTPLRYGSLFKWLSNRAEGIPAYIRIDMATQDVDLVRLEKGIRYSEAEHFGRNIYRHLRFNYPTYIFDTINFEIDDEGTPYWICPVKDYTIGLFGGQTVSKAVMVNAITGESEVYDTGSIPQWVDRVFSAELLINLYDYHGTLKHGYLNSVFSQKDALQTTDGYNYIVLEDDVWVYTGVTSVGADESNVGFVLMNQRTAETRFYSMAGAEEYSAMSSAEGKVQHLGYQATFPLLLNIGNQPTYFIALKDASGLVKSYAMVNIAQYQIVAIGDSVIQCEKTYLELMKTNGIGLISNDNMPKTSGVIKKIAEAVIDGNSHYYIILNNNNAIFDVDVSEFVRIITYNVGDRISLIYSEGTEMNTVLDIQ